MGSSRRGFLAGTIAATGATVSGCSSGALVGVVARQREDADGDGLAGLDAGFSAADAGQLDAGRQDGIDAGQAGSPDAQMQAPDAGAPGAPDAAETDAGTTPDACDDPFVGGQLIGELAFVNEGTAPRDRATGSGLDGRLYTELSTLQGDSLILPNDRFFIRTRYPDRLDRSLPWNIRMHGLVDAEVNLGIDDILSRARPMGAVLLECSGNGDFAGFGMLSAAEWSGVPLSEVLALANVSPSATRVLVSGFDRHSRTSSNSTAGASWIFTFDELERHGAFLATHMNGVELPDDHGYPVRLIMPRWYGCTNIKWVDEIQLVDDAAESTSQMREFASRTHQSGTPRLARDYRPAAMHQAAMPVRVEKWRLEGAIAYRVVGVMWGGERPTDRLQVRFGRGAYQDVDVCPMQRTNDTWTLWSHLWRPTSTGNFTVHLRVDDQTVPQQRLDSGFYDRRVFVDEV